MSGHHLARVRRMCLALPETSERLSHGEPTFFVHKKVLVMFADNHHGDGHIAVWLPVPPGAQAALIAKAPTTYFKPPYVGGRGWVGIELGNISDDDLSFHIQVAWELTAPKRLLPSLSTSSRSRDKAMPAKSQPTTALPKLAAPAQRALAAAGVTRLAQLCKFSEAEVKAWHGIGPNALKALRRALQAQGLSFASQSRSPKAGPAQSARAEGKHGLHTETFRDGKVAAVGRYANGRKTGLWEYFFRNGRLKAMGHYLHDKFEGLWKWYRENGQPLQVGSFKNGQQVGLWKRYRENGKLYDAGSYTQGKKTGVWKYYDANGKLNRTKTY